MDNYKFAVLNDENELIEYEKILYSTFKYDKRMLYNYKVVNLERLKPLLNYNNLNVFISKNDDKIVAGISGIINSERINRDNFQFEKIGFSIPHTDRNKNIFEIINFYITQYSHPKENLFKTLCSFIVETISEIKKSKVSIIYGTCGKSFLKIYELFGFSIVSSIKVDNEMEFLVKFEI